MPDPLRTPPTGLEPALPRGFDKFWEELIDEAVGAPIDYEFFHTTHPMPQTHFLRGLRFRSIDGTTLNGWVAQPVQDVVSPGFLWIPPYSRWSMLPNQYGTRPGYTSLSFNFFGESSFHQETYKPDRGYFAQGVESPKTWVFRTMAQNAVIAFRLLSQLPGVDPDRLGSMGMSQGGGISLWLGAMLPGVRAVVADMPFLAGMPWVFKGSVFRYPLKELTDVLQSSPRKDTVVRRTVSFFDTVNMATKCQVPTRVTLGLRDPAVRPEQVRAVYEALAGEKELEEFDWGHDWTPDMVTGGKAWLDKHL